MTVSRAASNRSRYSASPPGYSADSAASSKGSVRPNSKANTSPVWPRPENTAVGTSTHGVRMPPSALPCALRRKPVPPVLGEPGSPRWGLPIRHPADQLRQRRLADVVLLGAGVDRRAGLADDQVRRRAHELRQPGAAQRPVVMAACADDVGVGVGRTGQLPHADPVGVG